MTENSPVSQQDQDAFLRRAKTLSEALPFMRRYAGGTIVIKYGGHAMVDAALADIFAENVVLLKQVGIHPIVVHGGGPQIAQMLKRLDIKSEFVAGLRVTDEATVEVVEMVLSGTTNKGIVQAINQAGGTAVGLSGKDANLIRASRVRRMVRDPETGEERSVDLGLVGEPETVNPAVLEWFVETDVIPVIAPLGVGPKGETLNINADTVAGAVAASMEARRLLMLTDVAGVLDKDGNLIPEMTVKEARELMLDGTISGGMIPKVQCCIDAVEDGVDGAVIMDGRLPHALLLEIFTERGAGTIVLPD